MRHAPRNLRLACDHKGLTHFGGVYFFREFLQVLQFRNFFPSILPTHGATVDTVCRR